MSLTSLRAVNVRCLKEVALEPAESNLIFGENASGKTSLLEALFILGRGRSFRTASREAVIRDGEQEMLIAGVMHCEGRDIRLGLRQQVDQPAKIRVDGRDETSPAALARCLPVQIIDPDVHQLVEEGPGVRRRFLDWGVFHVEPKFLDAWRRYHRIVRQRNATLKSNNVRQLDVWDRELAAAGEALSGYRGTYLEALSGYVGELGKALLGTEPAITYKQGWPEDRSLQEALVESRARDLRLGITHPGPHRADMTIHLAAKKARSRVSRGQQKLLGATLVLAQLAHLKAVKNLPAILLLDDLPAELDSLRLGRLRDVVSSLDAQLFLTALSRKDLAAWNCGAVFHVEQGKVLSVL